MSVPHEIATVGIEPGWLTFPQAAIRAGCSVGTLSRRVSSGVLASYPTGHGTRVLRQQDVDALEPLPRGRPPRKGQQLRAATRDAATDSPPAAPRAHGLTHDEIRAAYVKSVTDQGLPLTIEDPVVIDRLIAILTCPS